MTAILRDTNNPPEAERIINHWEHGETRGGNNIIRLRRSLFVRLSKYIVGGYVI
jgi:hypothetical protein